MNPLRLLAISALGALVVSACGDSSPEPSSRSPGSTAAATTPASSQPAPSQPTTTAPATTAAPTTLAPDLATSLAGRTFVSSTVEGFTLVDGTQVSLSFDGPNIAAAGGCNQLASGWTLEGDVLVVAPMAQTQMACDPPALMDQDTWLSAVLTSRPTLALDGDTLTITAEGATVRLVDREVADPDVALEGSMWTVDTLVTGDAASSLPTGARPPTITLEAGTVSVDTGCNTGRGTYTVDADTVTFGPIATTRMACLDPAAQDVEQNVLAVLSGTAMATIDADTLTLTNGSNGLVAHAPSGEIGEAPAESIVGPTWRLESATSGGAAIAVGDRPPTLVFDGTTVAVDTGCNTGSGSYTANGTTITFGALATTRIACTDPAATMEATITSVLTVTAPFEIGADGALTLVNGATTLRYVPT